MAGSEANRGGERASQGATVQRCTAYDIMMHVGGVLNSGRNHDRDLRDYYCIKGSHIKG